MRLMGKIALGAGGAAAFVFVALLITGLVAQRNDAKKAEEMKVACANHITEAIRVTKTRDEAERLVRIDPKARAACAGFEMNGVAVIQ